MSTQRNGRETLSSARTAARVFAEFAGFAALLFVTRFVARGHLAPQSDQECHIGGIAVDVLAHGVRFPLMVYAPNEYDNGSFFSGLLASVSFSLLGRNVLALKLVTLLIAAAGAVATLWLLRSCLEELGLTQRRVRWTATAALIIAIALAPRVVTICSMYGIGNHTEGSAIATILLAVFAHRLHNRSATRTAVFWILAGVALYLNKGAFLVLPVLAAAQIALAWHTPRRLAAALAGFVLGVLPELLVISQRHGMGWERMASKAGRGSQAFPHAFLNTVWFLGEYRVELLGVWLLALITGIVLLARSRKRIDSGEPRAASSSTTIPLTLAMIIGVSCIHLLELTVMARNGLDGYVVYGYPTLVVLYSLLMASVCAEAGARWGERAAAWVGVAAVAATAVIYRPHATSWGFDRIAALWNNRAGAVCSWRFAEGFEREHDHGFSMPGETREQYALERCRTLSEPPQVLDCIGGIARELNWRQQGQVQEATLAGFDAAERRAYAYHFGVHRKGDTIPCGEFHDPELTALCVAAVQTECLAYGDIYTRIATDHGLARPRCDIAEPPMDGYWASMRRDFLSRSGGGSPNLTRAWGDDNLDACKPVFDACY